MSIGELWMPLQFFISLVNSSTTADMIVGGFFKSEIPNLVAADNALRTQLGV